MKRFTKFMCTALLAGGTSAAQGQLKIDFNSTSESQDGGPHLESGFQAYDAGHEVAADFITVRYRTSFALTGPAAVTLTPAWPTTTAPTVQQMMDRISQDTAGVVSTTSGFDRNWVGTHLNLVTDFIGIDSRITSEGNGNWDRSDATAPTYLTLTLGGLPAGAYNWLSYHHDTEKVWADFQADISVDSGATFGPIIEKQMTSSTGGAVPPTTMLYTGATFPDPADLPSTFKTQFTADGVHTVVIRFAPYADGIDGIGIHKSFFGINGFILDQVLPPSSLALTGGKAGPETM